MKKELKNEIKDLLLSTKREGMQNLIDAMEEGGFFLAPCSGKYHLCVPGGLAEHSMNVLDAAERLASVFAEDLKGDLSRDSVIICSLLHDLGKMGDYGKPNYVPNILKTGQSKSQPYKNNPDLIAEEHEIRSVIIANRYIQLTEEEQNAILHHNALWGKLDSSYSDSFSKYPLSLIIHYADLWCSRIVEAQADDE